MFGNTHGKYCGGQVGLEEIQEDFPTEVKETWNSGGQGGVSKHPSEGSSPRNTHHFHKAIVSFRVLSTIYNYIYLMLASSPLHAFP